MVEDPQPGTFSELLFTEKAVEIIENSVSPEEGKTKKLAILFLHNTIRFASINRIFIASH